ncbi:MAG: mannose-6-phosphate isomerase [Coprobacter sp.]|nr:mannose-6-phosphate isomerase [Coprobacter sp.]
MWKFNPILKQTIWGGDSIAPFKHLHTDLTHVGESWELSGVKGDESVIANGDDRGKTITQLLQEMKESLIGKANYARFGDTFPLLIKFIDARDDLSIQVHPNDEQAMAKHGKRGKTEMWYIVDTTPDAHLRSGFSQAVTPEQYAAKVADSTITEVLQDYNVKPGDVFFLPAGRIHSIGAGTFLAEIQETSDITYRIFDFDRRDANGNTRELHTELAKEVIDYTVLPDYRTHYEGKCNQSVNLATCEHFTTNLYKLDRDINIDYSDKDSFIVLIGLEGKCEISTDSESIALQAGETLLLPATTAGISITPAPACKLLETYIV